MKVTSRYKLIETVIIAAVYTILCIVSYMSDDSIGLSWIVLMVVIIAKGLYDSFSEAGYKADQKRKVEKKVCHKLFGRWAVIAPRGFEIFVIFAWASAELMPLQIWLALLLIMSAFGYQAWFTTVCNKQIELEEDQEREQK